MELYLGSTSRRKASRSYVVLRLPPDEDRASIKVYILPRQTKHLAQPHTAMVREHQRQVCRMAFREAFKDALHNIARYGISRFVSKLTTVAGVRQVNVSSGTGLNPALLSCIPQGAGDDTEQTGQHVARKALEIHLVDEGLNGIAL